MLERQVMDDYLRQRTSLHAGNTPQNHPRLLRIRQEVLRARPRASSAPSALVGIPNDSLLFVLREADDPVRGLQVEEPPEPGAFAGWPPSLVVSLPASLDLECGAGAGAWLEGSSVSSGPGVHVS